MSDVFRSEYRPLTADEVSAIRDLKGRAQALLDQIDTNRLWSHPERGSERYAALATTALEECVMWATKAITG